MAASFDDTMAASDLVEQAREMDGNLLRKETFTSASLSTKAVITYKDNGGILSRTTEDI